ncbi:hypothetical protein GEMRC1_006330 [Eukaryota sp. GEM-RC1]
MNKDDVVLHKPTSRLGTILAKFDDYQEVNSPSFVGYITDASECRCEFFSFINKTISLSIEIVPLSELKTMDRQFSAGDLVTYNDVPGLVLKNDITCSVYHFLSQRIYHNVSCSSLSLPFFSLQYPVLLDGNTVGSIEDVYCTVTVQEANSDNVIEDLEIDDICEVDAHQSPLDPVLGLPVHLENDASDSRQQYVISALKCNEVDIRIIFPEDDSLPVLYNTETSRISFFPSLSSFYSSGPGPISIGDSLHWSDSPTSLSGVMVTNTHSKVLCQFQDGSKQWIKGTELKSIEDPCDFDYIYPNTLVRSSDAELFLVKSVDCKSGIVKCLNSDKKEVEKELFDLTCFNTELLPSAIVSFNQDEQLFGVFSGFDSDFKAKVVGVDSTEYHVDPSKLSVIDIDDEFQSDEESELDSDCSSSEGTKSDQVNQIDLALSDAGDDSESINVRTRKTK